ncbi:MAG: hypothetical protein ACFCAD_21990 [Pleurocapsa sp.]
MSSLQHLFLPTLPINKAIALGQSPLGRKKEIYLLANLLASFLRKREAPYKPPNMAMPILEDTPKGTGVALSSRSSARLLYSTPPLLP